MIFKQDLVIIIYLDKKMLTNTSKDVHAYLILHNVSKNKTHNSNHQGVIIC